MVLAAAFQVSSSDSLDYCSDFRACELLLVVAFSQLVLFLPGLLGKLRGVGFG
jgi:hypothetical protein